MVSTQQELDDIVSKHHGATTVNAGDGLHLRPAPSLEGAVLTTLLAGTAFVVDGQSTLGFVHGSFNGQQGWAFAEFLAAGGQPLMSPVAAGTTATVQASDGLNLRPAPSLEGEVLTTMPQGAAFTLDGQSTLGFLHGTAGGQQGWAFAEFLSGDEEIGPPTLPLETAMHNANMHISQGPFMQPTHGICDCYDFGVVEGTPIFPIAPGQVIKSRAPNAEDPNDEDAHYAPNVVVVRTNFGDIRYAHLSVREVSVGQSVSVQTRLGLSGTAGTGGHLHLQLDGGADGPNSKGLSLTQILDKVKFHLGSFPREF